MERFVLWHRILPPAFEEEETTAAAGQWARYVTAEVAESVLETALQILNG